MVGGSVVVKRGVVMRLAALEDAEGFLEAYRRNRDHLRRWEPRREAAFFTTGGQAARLRDQLAQRDAGRLMPWVLVEGSAIVGAVALSNVALGPFRSANLGYWIDVEHVGQGLATSAVAVACQAAGEQLRLHRLE